MKQENGQRAILNLQLNTDSNPSLNFRLNEQLKNNNFQINVYTELILIEYSYTWIYWLFRASLCWTFALHFILREYSERANMADHLMLAISHKNYLKKVLTKVTIKVTNKNEMK